MKRVATLVCTVILLSGVSFAQGPDGSRPQGSNMQVPDGWTVRFDNTDEVYSLSAQPDTGDVYFVNMTPGWHITTGPRAIFYHEDNQASGDYSLSSKIYLFDTKGRDREAFGLFIGGQNLENENQEYVYFLIRNTGEYLIKRRVGESTETIQDWTETTAMTRYTDGEDSSTAENDFKVEVSDGNISFMLNDELLTTIDAGELNTDGVYGFRVNHAINLHISSLRME